MLALAAAPAATPVPAAPAAPASTPAPSGILTAPSTPKPATNGSRFLFVVDMSSSMKATDAANRQALFDLIFTGFEGQMRHGDTFGLWLFNDDVKAGAFPLQVWDELNPLEVASRATLFVRNHKYSGKPRLDEVVARMLQLARNVKDVHLVLLSTGEQPLTGTPLDATINETYARRQPDRRQQGKPLVTTLNVQRGEITSATVTLAGEYIELPARPTPIIPPTTPALAAKPTAAPARPAPAPNPIPPATEARKTSATLTAQTEPPTRTWTPNPAPAKTSSTTPAPPPPTADPIVVAGPIAAPQNPAPTPVAAPAPPTPSPVVVAGPIASPRNTIPAPAPVAPPTAPVEPLPTPATTIAATLNTTVTTGTPEAGAKESPKPNSLLTSLLPEPARVQAREQATPAPPAAPTPGTAGVPTVPAVPATVLVVQHPVSPTLLLGIASFLLAACVILLIIVARRSQPRARSQGSVITQSIDRQ
jgi:hypothetical protein